MCFIDYIETIPEKLVSIGCGHLSKACQDLLVMNITLLRDMLQDLPKLHTNTHRWISRLAHIHAFIQV